MHSRGIAILIVLATVIYMIVHALFQLVSVLFMDPLSSLLLTYALPIVLLTNSHYRIKAFD